ncbi:hypothetical protein LCM20_02150 [Halobacillus litoralis]|uniref:hypothetical protein n=1 Tax=Halobacillus litoralis TaxID=45668 RepID=UPI001CD65C70|nr:hypothetical protein [Halobacillus litoralis]MCA0969391.1 hypothetical protein [Halobacillus litoralis]
MKKVLLPLFLFSSLSVLLLLYQWGNYDNADQQMADQNRPASIEVEVTLQQGTLSVQYHFKEWEAGPYQVVLPENGRSITCSDECLSETETNHFMWTAESGQTLSYQVNTQTPVKWTGWTLQFMKDDQPIYPKYDLSFRDYDERDRTWIGLTTKQSDIVKDYVRYYQFEPTTSPHFPLVLLTDPSKKVWDTEDWMITLSGNESWTVDMKRRVEQLSHRYPDMLVEIGAPSSGSEGSYLSVKTVDQLEKVLFERQVESNYPQPSPEWAVSALSSLFFDDGSFEASKSGRMAKQMGAAFTEEEVQRLKQELIQYEGETSLLDGADFLLSDLYGDETTFFSVNADRKGVTPLYFTHSEPLVFGEKTLSGQMIDFQSEEYLPLDPVVKEAGYPLTVFEEEELYRVELPERSYRFFLDRSTFILNEQAFGVAADLLQKIDGKLYMKREFVDDLLGIRTYVQEDRILLQKK